MVGRAVNQVGAFTLPFLTIALTQPFGASIPTAGALMAVFGAATIASRLAGGRLADFIGRRNTIVAGLTLTAAAQLALAGAPSLAVAAGAVAVLGLAFEIYEPPSQALIADIVRATARPAAYGLLSAALSAAAVRLLFIVDAATCLSCAALLRVALPARKPTSASSTDQHPTRDRVVGGSNPWRDRRLLGRAYSLVADIAPEQSRARYLSVYGLCWGAAAVIGPFAGTQLLAHAGPLGLWTSCAIACGALACAQPGLRRLLAGTNPV